MDKHLSGIYQKSAKSHPPKTTKLFIHLTFVVYGMLIIIIKFYDFKLKDWFIKVIHT